VLFGAVAFGLIVVTAVAVGRFVPKRLRVLVWALVIMGGVVPWASWTDHIHWDRIEWVPFARFVRPRDIVLNVLAYVPFGYFLADARSRPPAGRMLRSAAAAGFVLSTLTELSQVFSHGRFPTATDVLTNTAGAVLGAWLALRQR
jgi:glycopeptide antibiotics resistance protein